MFNPVSPGEKITKQHMSAEWYNHTLKSSPQKNGQKTRRDRHGGIVRCKYETVGVDRYNVVGVTGPLSTDPLSDPILKVSSLATDINDTNWVISYEQSQVDLMGWCCVWGLCKAHVNPGMGGNAVTFNPATGALERSRSGRAQLFAYNGSDPSLIFLGNRGGILRIKGVIATAGNSASTSMAQLKGIDTIYGADPADTITVFNTHGWEWPDNAVARAEWVTEENRWELYQVTCS